MSDHEITLRNPKRAAFLAWLVPGLGHIYQGRVGKGILYAVCILSLYLVGFVMGEGKIVYWRWVNPLNNPDKFPLYYLGQFFVGLPALPALIQATLKSFFGIENFLGGFMAEPPLRELNGLHPRLGKLVEIASMYTAVAGLLNVLAIYDAYEGPAYAAIDQEEDAAIAASHAQSGANTNGSAEAKVEPTPTPIPEALA
jgi:TM2 domain-containing membrane protein YozV